MKILFRNSLIKACIKTHHNLVFHLLKKLPNIDLHNKNESFCLGHRLCPYGRRLRRRRSAGVRTPRPLQGGEAGSPALLTYEYGVNDNTRFAIYAFMQLSGVGEIFLPDV